LSYSYGRALQDEALNAWLGKPDNVAAGQRMFAHRGHLVSAARYGKYDAKMETAA
jgi:fructose-bisphosphate aldolase class I